MTVIQKIKRFLLPVAYSLLRLYWFVCRPKYRGAKIVITCGDEMLLIRHNYGPYYWSFPGGSIDGGETPKQTIVREVEEEVGIILDPEDVVETGSFVSTADYKDDNVFCFTVEVPNKNFMLNDVELAEAEWFKINEPPKELGAHDARKIFNKYLEYQKLTPLV